MTLDQIIGAITGVATLMAALGAMAAARGTFLSVEQVRKQTEASYRPQLSIAQAYVSCRNGTLLPLGSEYVKYPIPNSWTRSIGPVGKVSVPKRTLERFKLTVHNVGLGAALKVSVRWDCPLDQIINRIADLAEKMKHSSEKTEASEKIFSELERELGMLRRASINGWGSLGVIDFILPEYQQSAQPTFEISPPLMLVVSMYVYLALHSPENVRHYSDLNIKAILEYQDISSTRHKQAFQLDFHFIAISNRNNALDRDKDTADDVVELYMSTQPVFS